MTLPAGSEARVFAPATVANLGPGFDVLALALAEPGRTVRARTTREPGVRVRDDRGEAGAVAEGARLAAAAVAERTGLVAGLELELEDGPPAGVGLGGGEAAAAAAALAAGLLLGNPLRKVELFACGSLGVPDLLAHRLAASLLGGLILVRAADPPDPVRLPLMDGLHVAVVFPAAAPPRSGGARPARVPRADAARGAADLAALVAALHSGDAGLLARSLAGGGAARDEPVGAALAAGALGGGISGGGPARFALCRSRRSAGEVVDSMRAALPGGGGGWRAVVSAADCPGARKRASC